MGGTAKARAVDSLDDSQRRVVESAESRLYVVAPAGYGKTYTMAAKLERDLSCGVIPHPKRALCLTYSVNAARKMRNDVVSRLPRTYADRVLACNFHGLSRRILGFYGKLAFGTTIDMNGIVPLDDSAALEFLNHEGGTSPRVAGVIRSFDNAVRSGNPESMAELLNEYCDAVLKTLMPLHRITYNGIIALALACLDRLPAVAEHYRRVYPYVIIDEAQDTNALAYLLLKRFIDEQSKVYMFGDPFQRVYGFIGAMPDFMKAATADFGLVGEELEMNHRFDPASSMFLLESNLRAAIRDPFARIDGKVANIPLAFLSSVEAESERATHITESIAAERPGSKIAILTRFRESEFSTLFASKLMEAGVDYFDALFLDDEEEYVQFNQMCLGLLKRESSSAVALASKRLDLLFEAMADKAREKGFSHVESYCSLLEALRMQLREELPGVGQDERIEYLTSVFEERSLRHALEYVPANVIMTTMHASKGLEWDYVILPEMMQWVVPGWGACKVCTSSWGNTVEGFRCRLSGNWAGSSFKDEMKLFYVAVTRARRSVFCLATTDRVNSSGEHKNGLLSCFLSMPGVNAGHIDDIKVLI